MGKKWSPQVDPKCNFLVSLGTKVVRLSNTCIKAVAAAWRARHCGSSPYAHRRGDRFQSSFEGTPLDIYDRRANASHCPWIYYQQKAFKIHHKELTKSTVKNGKSVSGSSTYCGYNTKSEVEHIFFFAIDVCFLVMHFKWSLYLDQNYLNMRTPPVSVSRPKQLFPETGALLKPFSLRKRGFVISALKHARNGLNAPLRVSFILCREQKACEFWRNPKYGIKIYPLRIMTVNCGDSIDGFLAGTVFAITHNSAHIRARNIEPRD